jgi:hypothetical protein
VSAPGEGRDEIARREDALDDEILRLLFSSPYPWTVEELARELGDSGAEDGLRRLAGASLVHRMGTSRWRVDGHLPSGPI